MGIDSGRSTFPEEFPFRFQCQGILIDAVNTLEIPSGRLVNMLQVCGKWNRPGYAAPGEDGLSVARLTEHKTNRAPGYFWKISKMSHSIVLVLSPGIRHLPWTLMVTQ